MSLAHGCGAFAILFAPSVRSFPRISDNLVSIYSLEKWLCSPFLELCGFIGLLFTPASFLVATGGSQE